MQREPVFDAAATLPGWMPSIPHEPDPVPDDRVAAWVGGGLSLLMWACVTALAIGSF